MAGIIEKLKGSAHLKPLSSQDYANLTAKDKEELLLALAETGETIEDYEKRIKKLFPPEIELPVQWI